MIVKYLITNLSKLRFKKNSNLIFENEYLKKLYTKKELRNYNCSSIENLDQVYKKKIDILFCKKKVKRYLNEIYPILNKLNSINFKKKEWEILIEYYLYLSIIHLKRRFETFKKIRNKKNIIIEANNFDFFFENCSIYKENQAHSVKFNNYVNYLLSKKFQLKTINKLNSTSKSKLINIIEERYKQSVYKKFFYLFLDYFSFFLKPIIIFDGYFGAKNAIKVILKSKFKIFFANIDYFNFSIKKIILRKDHKSRSKISIKILDDFDYIYQEFIQNTLPSSYLENFCNYYKLNDRNCNLISKIGTSIHIPANDYFKFAIVNLKKKNKKIFNIQHGGGFGNKFPAPDDYVNNKFSDLNIYWNDRKKKIGSQYFLDLKLKKFKFSNEILLLPSHQLFHPIIDNLSNYNHLYLNQNWDLIKILCERDFLNLTVKFFKHKNDDLLKKIWKKNFNKKIKILDNNYSYKGRIFKDFDLIIVNDFSTAFYELMYYKKPFIVLNSAPSTNFKKEFWQVVQGLKKINLWFDDEKKLAVFLQNNIEDFILHWDKILKSNQYKKITKNLFATESFDDSIFVKNILKL